MKEFLSVIGAPLNLQPRYNIAPTTTIDAVRLSCASEWMAPYHDRMPVLLTPVQFDDWLIGTAGSEILKPAAEAALREWIVSGRMNKTGVGDDDPTIVAKAA